MKSAPILLALSATLASPAFAADEEALLADDIKFAENLARYQYFGLALDVVEDVQGNSSLSSDVEGNAVLTEARIYKRYSQSTSNDEEVARNQDKAIELLYDWGLDAGGFSFHPKRPDALQDLAELMRERGVRLKDGAENADDPESFRDRARSDFRDADKTYETLRDDAEDRAEQLEDDEQADAAAEFRTLALNTELFRAINFIEWAEIAADPESKLDSAVDACDNFAWELPEQGMLISYVGLQYTARALADLGDVTSDQELTVEALEIYDQCVEELRDFFWEAEGVDDRGNTFSLWGQLGPGQRAQVAAVTADSFSLKARLFVDLGRIDDSLATIKALEELHDTNNQPLGRRGHQAILSWVDALDRAGHVAKSLDAIKRIATEGTGTAEGERAARKLSSLDDNVVQNAADPSVLMTLASTFRKDKKYNDAAFTYLKVANSDLTDAERDEYHVAAWMGAAATLKSASRNLEAGLAFERALNTITELPESDELRASLLDQASGGFYSAYDQNYKQSGNPFDKSLRDNARQMLLDLGLADADLQFNAAREVYGEAERLNRDLDSSSSAADRAAVADAYRAAISELESVDSNAPSFERALVYVGLSHRGAGDSAKAVEMFDQMLARRSNSSLAPTDPKSRTRREQATAEALYYKAITQFEDLDDAAGALTTLDGLETTVPNQASFHELAKYQRVVFNSSIGNVDAAQAALDDLETSAPTSSRIGGAAFYLAATLFDASEAATDPAEAIDLKSRAADEMWKYAEALNFSSFSNTLKAADWYTDVGRFDDARAAYEQMLDVFASRAVEDVDDIKIGLATVLNEQSSFGEARQIWKDVYERNQRSPRVLRGAARCYGGWLEMDDAGNVVEVSGSGDYEDAFTIWSELKRGYDRSAKYHRVWWEAKLLVIYAKYRLGAANPQGFIDARQVLNNQRTSTPEYDRETQSVLEEEDRYTDLMRPYFKYLERKIPSS